MAPQTFLTAPSQKSPLKTPILNKNHALNPGLNLSPRPVLIKPAGLKNQPVLRQLLSLGGWGVLIKPAGLKKQRVLRNRLSLGGRLAKKFDFSSILVNFKGLVFLKGLMFRGGLLKCAAVVLAFAFLSPLPASSSDCATQINPSQDGQTLYKNKLKFNCGEAVRCYDRAWPAQEGCNCNYRAAEIDGEYVSRINNCISQVAQTAASQPDRKLTPTTNGVNPHTWTTNDASNDRKKCKESCDKYLSETLRSYNIGTCTSFCKSQMGYQLNKGQLQTLENRISAERERNNQYMKGDFISDCWNYLASKQHDSVSLLCNKNQITNQGLVENGDSSPGECANYCSNAFDDIMQNLAIVESYLSQSSATLAYKLLTKPEDYDSLVAKHLEQELFNSPNGLTQKAKNLGFIFGTHCTGGGADEQECRQKLAAVFKQAKAVCLDQSNFASDCCHSPMACAKPSSAGNVVVQGPLAQIVQAYAGSAGDPKEACERMKISNISMGGLQASMAAACKGAAANCQSTCRAEGQKMRSALKKYCNYTIGEQTCRTEQACESAEGRYNASQYTCPNALVELYREKYIKHVHLKIANCESSGVQGNQKILGTSLSGIGAWLASTTGCKNPDSITPYIPPPGGANTSPGLNLSTTPYQASPEEPAPEVRDNTGPTALSPPEMLPFNDDSDPNSQGARARGGLVHGGGGTARSATASGGTGGRGRRRNRRPSSSSGRNKVRYRGNKFGGYAFGGRDAAVQGEQRGKKKANSKKSKKLAGLDLKKLFKKQQEMNKNKQFGNPHQSLFNRISHRFRWMCQKKKINCKPT